MTFRSILNPSLDGDAKAEMSEPPAYFADLNLDQIVAATQRASRTTIWRRFSTRRSGRAKTSNTARR
jgi:hypothetical protein